MARCLGVILVLIVSVLAPTLPPAMAAAGKPGLASAIENRLNRLGDTTLRMTAAAGYFYRNPTLPQQAFYTYAGCQQTFRFSVSVYKTAAQAEAMYNYYYQHVLSIGGNFSAFNMLRSGRVIYTADTAPGPGSNAPPVPTQDFRSLAAEVGAPLSSHPNGGSTPKPSDL